MDLQFLGVIAFFIFMSSFLIIKRKKLSIQKILYPAVYIIMYKTKLGLNIMKKFAEKHHRALKFIGYFAIFIGFAGMTITCYALLKNLIMITKPEAKPAVGLVLPIPIKGAFYVPFFYWIIAIFITALIHEFSHGVIAQSYKLRIRSSGFAFFSLFIPIIPAAFVEPDEKEFKKRPPKQQLSVFAAGPFANIVFAFLILGVSSLTIVPLISHIVEFDGVKIVSVMENDTYPAFKSGMKAGEIIIGINNKSIKTVEDFQLELHNKSPGETIIIATNRTNYNITLIENPRNRSRALIGIFVQQSQSIKKEVKQKYYIKALLWFSGLIYWLLIFNLGIGLFNLVPIGPLDGGRMLYTILSSFLNKKRALRVWNFVGSLFLTLVLLNIIIAFLR